MTWRSKLRLSWCLAWYPIFALTMLGGVLLPIIALLTRSSFVSVSLSEFGSHSLPPTLILIATALWLRSQGWTRPTNIPRFSTAAVLFQFARWPWVVLGVVASLIDWLRGKESDFRVTPKGQNSTQLSVVMLIPYLTLAVTASAVAVCVTNPGPAKGYYLFTLVDACVYGILPVIIMWRHWRESRYERST